MERIPRSIANASMTLPQSAAPCQSVRLYSPEGCACWLRSCRTAGVSGRPAGAGTARVGRPDAPALWFGRAIQRAHEPSGWAQPGRSGDAQRRPNRVARGGCPPPALTPPDIRLRITAVPKIIICHSLPACGSDFSLLHGQTSAPIAYSAEIRPAPSAQAAPFPGSSADWSIRTTTGSFLILSSGLPHSESLRLLCSRTSFPRSPARFR